MGLFDGLFGNGEKRSKEEKKTIPWIPLASIDQLEVIKEKSMLKLQVVFKHSTTCGISRMVLNTFVNTYDLSHDECDLYHLDLLSNREVSNETGFKFQVRHESPQLLVIKNGEVIQHASHGGINEIDLKQYI